MELGRLIVLDFFIVSMTAVAGFGIFAIVLPAQVKYDWYFGRHVKRAYSEDTFDEIETEVMTIWNQMNITFAGRKYNETFCTPWYWQQIYRNSLAAQNDYLRQLVNRIDSYQDEYEKLRINNTDLVIRIDWYDRAIQDLRVEMKREGSLDRVVRGAWFLTFAPAAYWLGGWLTPIAVILIAIAVILVFHLIVNYFMF